MRRLIVLLSSKNAANRGFAQARYTAGTRNYSRGSVVLPEQTPDDSSADFVRLNSSLSSFSYVNISIVFAGQFPFRILGNGLRASATMSFSYDPIPRTTQPVRVAARCKSRVLAAQWSRSTRNRVTVFVR